MQQRSCAVAGVWTVFASGIFLSVAFPVGTVRHSLYPIYAATKQAVMRRRTADEALPVLGSVPVCQTRALGASMHVIRILACVVAANSASASNVTVAQHEAWCHNQTEPNAMASVEICLEASIGPMAGGVLVTIKGMQRAADRQNRSADWTTACDDASWWRCTFDNQSGVPDMTVQAKAASCQGNYVVCESPRRQTGGDVLLTVSKNGTNLTFPSFLGRREIFSYYGAFFLTCCSSIARSRSVCPARACSPGMARAQGTSL